MMRPFRCAASKLSAPLAADDLAEIRADRRLTELIASPPESDPDRRGALVAGSAIHRVMETFDLTADPEVELERQRRLLPEYLRMFASAEEAEAAFSRARHLFDRLAGGRLLRRFLEIREGIVARELPVLLPPAGEGDPVGFLTGTIDLV
ncbi:MAG: hypothetical protein GY841_21715, partial [FCB group bacterium]|nr:hypothetical protein [FCB group bacterium]